MAQPPRLERTIGSGGFRNLALRLRSAALLAPLAAAGIYFGSPWFDMLIIFAGLIMSWEWASICSEGDLDLVGWLMEAGIIIVLGALYLGSPFLSLCVAVLVASVVAGLALLRRHKSPLRLAMGAGMISVFCLSFLWLRRTPDIGLELVVWLVLAVWFTDVGGYFFGKLIGGPKLAPRISPNKTWAGLGGGILLAALWSVATLSWAGGYAIGPVIAAALCIALLAQFGDLCVSTVKRRFGVKDASSLIPGHGGFLDRLDGMLLTGPASALVLICSVRGWI